MHPQKKVPQEILLSHATFLNSHYLPTEVFHLERKLKENVI